MGNWEGVDNRQCGDHRTTGGRAWCFDCQCWCYDHAPCAGCGPLGMAPEEIGFVVGAKHNSDGGGIVGWATSDPLDLDQAKQVCREQQAAETSTTWTWGVYAVVPLREGF